MDNSLKSNTLNKQRWLLGILTGCFCSTLFAISPIKDEALATDVDYVGTITPVVITAVKRDVQNTIEQQNQKNNELATKQSREIKKDHLAYVVLNDYEQQRQEADPYQYQIEQKPISPNKMRTIEYGISAQNNTVTVTTADKITIYVSRDAH